MTCPFCDYEGPVLYEDEDVFIITPLEPVTPGHVLVIPWEHVQDATEKPPLTGLVMMAAAWWAKAETPPRDGSGANIITSVGEAATQTVKHLHVHVVPRVRDDGLMLPWSDPGQAPAIKDAVETFIKAWQEHEVVGDRITQRQQP